jgi:sulfate/thiosulfate transport system ATP-binding protein
MKVELRNLRRSFRDVVALDNVSLTVPSGQLLALLGPSGSGKTTLLRVLAGLEFIDSGEILVGGRDMRAVPARERGVGLVFQHYALFRHMTVARNIAFGLEVRPRATRPDAATISRRVEELLDLMGIPELAGRYPHQISGGQRQRVALARALAIDPALLLLDEPFGALDAKVRKNLRRWLRELHDRIGLTTIFVTHDQDEAMEMADCVAVMQSGRIEQSADPERLYANPSNAFVHEFLGESIRLDCQVRDGQAWFGNPGVAPVKTGCAAGPAIALIRPYEIALTTQGGPAEVVAVYIAGPLMHIRLVLDGHVIDVVQPAQNARPEIGSLIGIDLSRAKIYPADPGKGDDWL